jgi:hypothetical protein
MIRRVVAQDGRILQLDTWHDVSENHILETRLESMISGHDRGSDSRDAANVGAVDTSKNDRLWERQSFLSNLSPSFQTSGEAALLLEPFTEMAARKDRYMKIMFEYKMKLCLDMPCADPYQCWDYHSEEKDRRRDPRVIRDGVPDNYPPWCSDYECSSFEMCYHPSSYKTRQCQDYSIFGQCSRGQYCPFAHGKDELLFNVLPEIFYSIMSFEDFHSHVTNFKVTKCIKSEAHNHFDCPFYHNSTSGAQDSGSDRRSAWAVDESGEYIEESEGSSFDMRFLPSRYKTTLCCPKNPFQPCPFKHCSDFHSERERIKIQEYKTALSALLNRPTHGWSKDRY